MYVSDGFCYRQILVCIELRFNGTLSFNVKSTNFSVALKSIHSHILMKSLQSDFTDISDNLNNSTKNLY